MLTRSCYFKAFLMLKLLQLNEVCPKPPNFHFFDKKLKRIWSFLRARHLPHSHNVYCKIVYLFIHNPSNVRPFFNVQTVTTGWQVPRDSKFSFFLTKSWSTFSHFWEHIIYHAVILQTVKLSYLSRLFKGYSLMFKLLLLDELCPKTPKFHFFDKNLKCI